MKKVGRFLLAVVLVAGFAGCGGDGDDEFTFTGMWEVAWDSGAKGDIVITQNGSRITIDTAVITGAMHWEGTCDAVAGTFYAGNQFPSAWSEWTGTRIDDDHLEGTLRIITPNKNGNVTANQYIATRQ